jgi:cytosine/adenosine deaminase-related metal-dependent hydrolase
MMTLVRGARVLTLDAADTEHAKADILIEGTLIAAIGPDLVAPGADVIDAAGLIAMPGLINGHFHSQVSLMAGSVPSLPLELFMLYEVPPLGDRPPDPRLIYLQTMLGSVEMLRHGITACMTTRSTIHGPLGRQSTRLCPPIAIAGCARQWRSTTRIGLSWKNCRFWWSYCRLTFALKWRRSASRHWTN